VQTSLEFDDGAAPVGRSASSGAISGIAVALVAGVLAATVTPTVLGMVAAAGRTLTSRDIPTDYVKGVLWAIALSATIPLWPIDRSERRAVAILWGIKVLVTLGLMLPYEWYYESLDGYGYFAASQQTAADFSAVRMGNGTALMNAFGWLHGQLLVESYHAMKVTCAMLGLIALFILYRAAVVVSGRRDPRILLALGCVPSVLFWSSILGKDPVVLLGIALYAHGVTHWLQKRRLAFLPTAAIGLWIATAMRLWLAPMLLLPLAVVALVCARHALSRVAIVGGSAAALAIGIARFGQRFAVAGLSDSLEALRTTSQSWATGGSAQVIAADLSSPVELLKFLPRGIAAALVRPLPGEIMNPFGLLAGFENGALIVALLVAVTRVRRAQLRQPIVIWAIGFVLLWATVYGPFSYQNLGTAVRFRLQVLPVMLLLLAYFVRRDSSTGRVTTLRPHPVSAP
jgi:hypothetical protein